jgi:hypothetical protein
VAQQTLFVAETPTLGNIAEGIPVTVATTVVFAEDGTLDGIQVYAPATVTGTFSGAVWEITADDSPATTGTGTLIATVAMPSLTASAWQIFLLASPVPVIAGVAYRIGFRTSEGRYVATGGGFNSGGMVNGDISSPQTETNVAGIGLIANGTFIESTSSYPNKTFNGNKYFVGPVFTAASTGPEDHTSSGTARAIAVATAASLAARISSGSARSVALAAALDETARITDGLAVASAAASAAVIARRVSTGSATAVAGATAAVVPRRTSSGTARAIATGSNYTASGAPGPRLVSRNDPTRIVTRTQVAR